MLTLFVNALRIVARLLNVGNSVELLAKGSQEPSLISMTKECVKGAHADQEDSYRKKATCS